MAILNAFIPGRTSDIVSILRASNSEQAFREARPIKISSNSAVTYMQNPIETGGNIIDHRIIEPDLVSVSCVIPNFAYRNLVTQIRDSSRNSEQFTVQSKSITYTNMVIEEMPIEEDPDKFDAIVIELKFREVQFDTAQIQRLPVSQVSNSADSSTVDRGEQSTSDSQSSVAFQAAQAIGTAL